LPLGGLARALTTTTKASSLSWVGLARYLAISGIRLNVQDLYSLGWITHVTANDVFDRLFRTLGDTVHGSDRYKSTQAKQISVNSLSEILECMHIGDLPIFEKIQKHNIWEKFLLVTPQERPSIESSIVNVELGEEEEFGGIRGLFPGYEQFIKESFDGDKINVIDTIKRLNRFAKMESADPKNQQKKVAAILCLRNLEQIPESLVQDWYDLTEFSSKAQNLGKALEKELTYLR
jgi:hypothetical protein